MHPKKTVFKTLKKITCIYIKALTLKIRCEDTEIVVELQNIFQNKSLLSRQLVSFLASSRLSAALLLLFY